MSNSGRRSLAILLLRLDFQALLEGAGAAGAGELRNGDVGFGRRVTFVAALIVMVGAFYLLAIVFAYRSKLLRAIAGN